MPEEQKVTDPGQEQLLLHATVEELVLHDLALRENADDGRYLGFPSQFNRDYEGAPEPKGKAVAITFDGSVQSLYSTLAVRLGRSGLFKQGNTGHPQVQIRAGIHIGPMHVEAGDVFGGTVNFAARVVGAIEGAEIWLSDRAKEDIDRLGAAKHKHLKWERHEGVVMKGFPGKFTLWAVAG